jgi:hypothetical protein
MLPTDLQDWESVETSSKVAFQNAHEAPFLLPKRFAICLHRLHWAFGLPLGSPDLSGDAVLSMIRCSHPESLHDPRIPYDGGSCRRGRHHVLTGEP